MGLGKEQTDVLIAGYLSRDGAMDDYASVLACGGHPWGTVVVRKDLESETSV